MKSLIVSAIMFSVILLYLSDAISGRSITWGSRGPHDRLLAREVVKKKAGWVLKQKVIVVFPPKGVKNYVRISAIHAIDRGSRENYSTAELVEGGPGSITATIKVKSQTRKPIDMIIEYFGH